MIPNRVTGQEILWPAIRRVEMDDLTMDTKARLGRMTFRAWRRGFREADMILGPFVEQIGPHLDTEELNAFEALLDEDDYAIYGWVTGKTEVSEPHTGPLMDRLQAFVRTHVAAAVATGLG